MHKRPKKVSSSNLTECLVALAVRNSDIIQIRAILLKCISSFCYLPYFHKQSNPSDRNRRPSEHAVDKRDMSGPGWLFPEDEGWGAYDESVHGALDDDIKERVEGLDPVWVRIINPKTGEPVLSD